MIVKRKFTNENGKEIVVALQTHDDGTLTLFMIGPESTTESRMTRMEGAAWMVLLQGELGPFEALGLTWEYVA